MEFRIRLKELRQEKKMTQQSLGETMGVAGYTIKDWEIGRCEPNIRHIIDLANFFDMSADYLLGNSDDYYHEGGSGKFYCVLDSKKSCCYAKQNCTQKTRRKFMEKFVISTDTNSDYLKSEFEAKKLYYGIIKRIQDGVEYEDVYDSEAEFDAFFESIKKGALPTTTQLNPHEFEELFTKMLNENPNKDIVHIGISSGLSKTHENAIAVANQMNTELSGRKIYVIDSLAASSALRMLVDLLIEKRDQGTSAKEAVEYIEYVKTRQHTWAVIDDLGHLKRGGRISGAKAMIGKLLGIKPIITINAKGKLAIESKPKGSAKAISYIVSQIEKQRDEGGRYDDYPIYLIHTSAKEAVKKLEAEIKNKYPNKQVLVTNMGPVVGTHVGGGLVAVVFIGKERLNID
ncbi:MAG: DegV family EDD domain-containing protein [Firmicutes bacterium]|nr:DegV family EDD domain-containing protein [Bacillota bacterium]